MPLSIWKKLSQIGWSEWRNFCQPLFIMPWLKAFIEIPKNDRFIDWLVGSGYVVINRALFVWCSVYWGCWGSEAMLIMKPPCLNRCSPEDLATMWHMTALTSTAPPIVPYPSHKYIYPALKELHKTSTSTLCYLRESVGGWDMST